jgi:predicted RNA methylase
MEKIELIPENIEIAVFNSIHNIHQYLYDNNINLTKFQRARLFAVIFILYLKRPNIPFDINAQIDIYELIMDVLNTEIKDECFSKHFVFIKDKVKNEHLLNMLNYVLKFISLNSLASVDIMRMIYNEINNYNKTDDGKLGIVLTPKHIVDLMITELDIKQNESFIDFCCGTGSFPIKAKYFTTNLFACDNNEECYTLTKCAFILSNINLQNITYNSCFELNLPENSFDCSAINPPFAVKNADDSDYFNEQKFVMYQLKILKQNGRGVAVFPRSNLTDNRKNNQFKEDFLKLASPYKTMTIPVNTFQPTAMVCCVILFYTKTPYKNTPVKIINETNTESYNLVVTTENNWVYFKQLKNVTDVINDTFQYITKRNLDLLTKTETNNFAVFHNGVQRKIIVTNYDVCNQILYTEWIPMKFLEVFKIVKSGKQKKSEKGEYNLISSSKINKGITGKCETFDYEEKCLTLAINGSVGKCFYHDEKIGLAVGVIVIKPNIEGLIMSNNLADYITNHFGDRYTWGLKLSIGRLKDEIIYMPKDLKIFDLFDKILTINNITD